GQVEAGSIRVGDEITALPSRETAKVKSVLIGDGEAEAAATGQPATIQLDREVDVSRGCVLTTSDSIEVTDMLSATLLWMDDGPRVEGRAYLVKAGTKTLPGTVMSSKHKIDINSRDEVSAGTVYKNALVVCDTSLSEDLIFDTFENNEALGGPTPMDRVSNATSAAGIINHSLRRATN